VLISSITGSGTADLMQKVSAKLELLDDEEAVAAAESEALPDTVAESLPAK